MMSGTSQSFANGTQAYLADALGVSLDVPLIAGQSMLSLLIRNVSNANLRFADLPNVQPYIQI